MDISEIRGWLCRCAAPLIACAFVAPLSAQDANEPLEVEVVDGEVLEERLVTMPNNLARVLDGTAGLLMQPANALFGGTGVRIQGLRGRYTSILTDGLPLYGSQSGSLSLVQIPVMDIGQIEVIGGAASALYGTTALGGVVNLISRRPVREREFLLSGTTLGGSDAVLWMADEWSSNWGYTVLGAVHRQGQSDVDDDGWADVPDSRRVFVRPRLFWNNGQGRSLVATVGGIAEDRRGDGGRCARSFGKPLPRGGRDALCGLWSRGPRSD